MYFRDVIPEVIPPGFHTHYSIFSISHILYFLFYVCLYCVSDGLIMDVTTMLTLPTLSTLPSYNLYTVP
jgi:hypothetical protein